MKTILIQIVIAVITIYFFANQKEVGAKTFVIIIYLSTALSAFALSGGFEKDNNDDNDDEEEEEEWGSPPPIPSEFPEEIPEEEMEEELV